MLHFYRSPQQVTVIRRVPCLFGIALLVPDGRRQAQEACSSMRSLPARQRPRVGPMLPIGSPSSSDMSA